MLKKSTLAAGLMAAAVMGFTALPASAAQFAPAAKPLAQTLMAETLVQEARHHNRRFSRCHAWRRECSFRWGFRTPRFNRCMFLHGCF